MRLTMDELTVLQATRLKGRVTPAGLAGTLDRDEAKLVPVIARLVAAGMLVEGKNLRLSADGRERLTELLAEERRGINTAVICSSYNNFRSVNAQFKSLVSDWQLKNGEPNDHGDAEYDARVLARLDRVHESVLPIVATVADQLPRLGAYADKLRAALAS
jgi:DNA-binding MarR family transcriptional regulator